VWYVPMVTQGLLPKVSGPIAVACFGDGRARPLEHRATPSWLKRSARDFENKREASPCSVEKAVGKHCASPAFATCARAPHQCLSFGRPCHRFRAVPSFELAISQAIYHSKWLLGRFLGLMKGIEGQATETPRFRAVPSFELAISQAIWETCCV
jgi:hypothetical protein